MRLLFFFFLFPSILFAQTLLKTKQEGWQQLVNYTISVRLNDVEHTLSATEKMVYVNNSPNELNEIYIHLWANAYKNIETAFAKQEMENGETDFYYSSDEDKGWIDSLDFKVDGQKVKWYLLDDIDICKIELNQPLKTGQQIEITTPFKVKIPRVFSRMGHQDQTYCISQWYPKPAVYDVNGWNYFPYLNQGEFYSEFGKFEVSISVPKNYVLAATGELQNEDEKVWLMEISAKKFETQKTHSNKENPASSTQFKTLRFVQNDIHDFAWFCDKRFSVERSEVQLKSGKKITTWLYEMFPQKSSVHWVDTAVSFYSRLVGEYPYSNVSVVVTPLKAGGGMEYPTITNVESASEQVIVHEVGHNWFYGIIANNERIYPWMDESINTYYETRCEAGAIKIPLHKGVNLGKTKKKFYANIDEEDFGILQLQYLLNARTNDDQPINIPSMQFTDANYGMIIYGKGPLAFHHLQTYLGDSLFDEMMRTYFDKWKFKHPLPDDFMNHAKSFTGKNLDWFFNDLMNTTIKPDYKIVSAKSNKIVIKNKTTIASPFLVSSIVKDTINNTQWVDGFTGKKTIDFEHTQSNKIRIDAYETSLDVYRNNNTIRTKGILKSVEPIQFKFLGDIENPYKTQLFYTPIIGANLYNKTMLGIAFYNGLLPRKKFDFTLAPMYSFGTNDIVGYASLERHFTTYGVFKQVHFGVNAARFGYGGVGNDMTYNKASPFLYFDLNKNNKRSLVEQKIWVRSVIIFNTKNAYTKEAPFEIASNSAINEIVYTLENKKAINPNSLKITAQHIYNRTQAVKLFAEAKQTITYDKPNKQLDVIFFAGTFLYQGTGSLGHGEYNYRTSGNTGQFDYTFDQALFGRSASDGLFAHQIIERDGYLKIPIPSLSTKTWMAGANLVSTIPGPIPIRVFADINFINAIGVSNVEEIHVQYVAGLKLVVVENIFDINFPLFYSDDFETYYNNQSQYSYKDENPFDRLVHRISFTLNLNKLNPIKGVRDYKF